MKREAYEHMIAKRMDFCEGSSSDLPAFLRHQGVGMGLAHGGRMRQEIFTDPHGRDVWDTLRCVSRLLGFHDDEIESLPSCGGLGRVRRRRGGRAVRRGPGEVRAADRIPR